MTLETLARQLEQEQADAEPGMIAQVYLLYEALENPDSAVVPVLAQTLALMGMTAFIRAFGLASTEQFRWLRQRPTTFMDSLTRVPALQHGAVMQDRVVKVLRKPHTEAQLAAYGRVLADVSTTFGARAGFDEVGKGAGAKRKQFVRVARVKEPRVHSVLEGRTIPVSESWNLNGYRVPSPAHPSLPLSERLFCKHVNLYLP